MKGKVFITLMSLFIMTILTSCHSDIENNDETITLLKAKWKISDLNSVYASFEFTKDGNFIVVENGTNANIRTVYDNKSFFSPQNTNVSIKMGTKASSSKLTPVHFGTFQIDGNTINLPDFGTIIVTSISAEEFSFSFTLAATGKKWNFITNKAQELTQSKRTEMLCRTWTINKVTIDEALLPEADKNWYEYQYGQNWKVEAEKEFLGTVVLFTEAGTYLISYADKDSKTALSWWKWANKEETAIIYSEDNWQDNWQGNNGLIKELTGTTFKMQEKASISYELGLYCSE